MGATILKAIKSHLETDRPGGGGRPSFLAADLATLLPGGIWTRAIQPWRVGEEEAPGNTVSAFDSRGRIQRCLSITSSPLSAADDLGPVGAYRDFPELYLRCLPHTSEKEKLEQAIQLLHVAFRDAVLVGAQGEGLCVTVSGQIGPFDDQIIDNAVLYMVRVRVDSIWKV